MENIKRILSLATKSKDNNNRYFNEAFEILNKLISQRNINDPSEMAIEMCIILAESAIKQNNRDIPEKCIKLYFSLDPPENQYLARAYIVQAQLIHPKRFDDEKSLEKPIGYILKGVQFAKKEKRYNYLVFNCSVVYYQIVRNFLRPGFYQFIVKSLSQITKALEEVHESNMAWRAQMQCYLVYALIDSGRKKEVIQSLDATCRLISKYAPHLLKDILNLLIMNNMGNTERCTWNQPAMQVYQKVCKLKQMKDKEGESSVQQEARKVYLSMTGHEEMSGEGDDTKGASTGPLKLKLEQRCVLLLELAKVCFQRGILNIARQSIEKIKNISNEEMFLLLQEVDFLDCDLTVFESDSTGQRMTPSIVQVRLRSIEKCRLTLDAVIRCQKVPPSSITKTFGTKINVGPGGFNSLLEYGCVTMWNLCLPLLHIAPHHIEKIHPQLVKIAEILDNIQSLQYRMCCQIHIEIGRGYALNEQSDNALIHFKQAIDLDRSGEYKELITQLYHSTELRETLYSVPEDPIDRAIQLLEQVRSSSTDSGTLIRPVLTQIGLCLAPDDFQHLLDRDLGFLRPSSQTSEHSSDSSPISVISNRRDRIKSWFTATQRLGTFLKRSGNVGDRDKMGVWVGLIKVARQAQVWDICRVASCFAILYDDGRWKNEFQNKIESAPTKKSAAEDRNTGDSKSEQTTSEETVQGEPEESDDEEEKNESTEIKNASRYEKWLLEQICDVYFIRAESFIESLRLEGCELFTYPKRPVDLKKRPQGYVKDISGEDSAWNEYCEQLRSISDMVMCCYEKTSGHAVVLEAPWIAQNSAVYLWNYTVPVLKLGEHHILVQGLQTIYDNLRQLLPPPSSSTLSSYLDSLVQIGSILAHGLVQKHMPEPHLSIKGLLDFHENETAIDKKSQGAKKPREKSPKQKSNINTANTMNPTEIAAANKKALEITQYLMDITTEPNPQPIASQSTTANDQSTASSNQNTQNSTNKNPVFIRTVSLDTKYQLIQIWCLTKQLQHSPISKNIITDDPEIRQGQIPAFKAIVSTQMVWMNMNDIFKFPESPSLQDCIQLFDAAELVTSINSKSNINYNKLAMEILIRLCQVAMTNSTNSKSIITELSERAHKILELVDCSSVGKVSQPVSRGSSKSRKSQQPTSNPLVTIVKQGIGFIDFCLGVCIHKNASNQLPGLLNCLEVLVYAAKCGKDSENYHLVSSASHYIWQVTKSIIKLTSSLNEITEPLRASLDYLTSTVDKRRLKLFFEPHMEEEKLKIEDELLERLPYEIQVPENQKMISILNSKSLFSTIYRKTFSKSALEQDLLLRIKFVVVIYKSYMSKNLYKEALDLIENSLFELPRTNHRMELFKLRILTKIRLGQNIDMDIQKFRHQPENEVAKLWQEVAIHSIKPDAQLSAYKSAIEALKKPENDQLKVEIILELIQWMYHQDYPIKVMKWTLEWAIDILLNMKTIQDNKPNKSDGKRQKGSGIKSGTSSKKSVKSNTTKNTGVSINEEITKIEEKDSSGAVIILQETPPIIGCTLQSYRPSFLTEIINIAQLSVLFKCFVYASAIYDIKEERLKYLLLGGSCIEQLWKTSMANVTGSMKDMLRSKTETETPTKNKDKKDKKEKGSKPEAEQQTKTKVAKRKGAVDWLPTNYTEWSLFEVTDEVLEVLSSKEFMKQTGFHSKAIPNLSNFIGCCDEFINQLEQFDLDPLVFPTLSLLDAFSRSDDSPLAKVRNQYIHLRALKVSLKLNLENAAIHHEEFLEMLGPTPEQINFASSLITHTLPSNTPAPHHPILNTPSKSWHVHRITGKHGQLHYSWFLIGQLLGQLGYHKESELSLHESKKLSIFYNDCGVEIDCDISSAHLKVLQGEIGEATQIIDLLEQKHSIFTLDQWKQIIQILTEIGQSQSNSIDDIIKIITRIERMQAHTQTKLTKLHLANQKAELFLLDNLFNRNLLILKCRIKEIDDNYQIEICKTMLDSVINNYIQMNEMDKLYEIVKLKLKFDFNENSNEDNSDFEQLIKLRWIQKIRFLQEIISLFKKHLESILNHLKLTQSLELNLTTQRQLATLKVILSESLLKIMEIETKKKIQINVERSNKEVVEQMIDEYVEEDQLTSSECIQNKEVIEEWNYLQLHIEDDIVSHLGDAHNLAGGILSIQAEILMLQANLLYLKSIELNPHKEEHWNLITAPKDNSSSPLINQEYVANESETVDQQLEITDHIINPVDKMRRQSKWERLLRNNLKSQEYMTQCIEITHQALAVAINNQQYPIAVKCCELLLECFGQLESGSPAMLALLLLQSCHTATQLRQLLFNCVRKASLGRLGALLCQKHQLDTSPWNLTSSTLYKSILEKLNNEFVAWKVSTVTLNHNEMVKELTSCSNGFCIIQASQNKDKIYCAFVDPKQKSTPPSKTGKTISDRSCIGKMYITKSELTDLLKDWDDFRNNMNDAIFKIENKLSLAHEQAQIVVQCDNPEEIEKEKQDRIHLNNQVDQVLNDLTNYYNSLCQNSQEILGPLVTNLNSIWQNVIMNDNQKYSQKSNNLKDPLILLCDPNLCGIVMENLEPFKDVVARDLSVQVLYYRYKLHGMVNDSELPDAAAAAGEKKKEKTKLPPRIPALRDTNKKTAVKTTPLNRQFPANSLTIDTNQIRYIIDPHLDTEQHPQGSLCKFFRDELIDSATSDQSSVTINREAQITSKWIGLLGDELACADPAQLEIYLRDAHALEFINTESFLSMITPQRVAMLNTTEMKLICLFDRNWTRKTQERYLDAKNKFKLSDLRNLDATRGAQLLTLMGCRSFISTEWAQLLTWITERVTRFHKNFLDSGLSLEESINDKRHLESIKSNQDDQPKIQLTLQNQLADGAVILYGLPNVYLGSA